MPTTIYGITLHVEGLRWHDPISVVGVPSHSYGYGVVAPPRIWGRGIRNAAHPPFRSPFYIEFEEPSGKDSKRMDMDEPIAKKAYYSIGEVCDLTGLKAHVLRYWETQFEFLHPTKNRAGNRVFRPKEIELILLVKHLLYDQKFTIDGARQRLLDMRKGGEILAIKRDMLDQDFLAGMKQELRQVKEVLAAPPSRLDT